jgi:hypothetical protein
MCIRDRGKNFKKSWKNWKISFLNYSFSFFAYRRRLLRFKELKIIFRNNFYCSSKIFYFY